MDTDERRTLRTGLAIWAVVVAFAAGAFVVEGIYGQRCEDRGGAFVEGRCSYSGELPDVAPPAPPSSDTGRSFTT